MNVEAGAESVLVGYGRKSPDAAQLQYYVPKNDKLPASRCPTINLVARATLPAVMFVRNGEENPITSVFMNQPLKGHAV